MLEHLSIWCYYGMYMPSKNASSADNQQERSFRNKGKKALLLVMIGALLGYAVFYYIVDPYIVPLTGYRSVMQYLTIALFIIPGAFMSPLDKRYEIFSHGS